MQIIDGKKLSEDILGKVKEEVSKLPFVPVFCDILVGEDPASAQYVKMKAQKAESVGMKFHTAHFPGTITTENLIKEIEQINQIPYICGLIVQLPLPPGIDRQRVLNSVRVNIDVDCLGEEQSARFYEGRSVLGFPTALACMELLDSTRVELKGKNIVVLGQGALVGMPVTALLKFRGLEPQVVTRKTENQKELIKNADVIISGIGQSEYIKGDMIKPGVIIIDAGTSEMNSGIVGDVDQESVKEVAGYLSPVPGGVGPVTVAMLLKNVLVVANICK